MSDPLTLPQDSKARKGIPLFSGVARYFPAALAEVAKVSRYGNDKHRPGKPLAHSRGLSSDHADCILRHLLELEDNAGIEPDSGIPQVALVAWRALALCQEWMEEHRDAPPAPAADFGDAVAPTVVTSTTSVSGPSLGFQSYDALRGQAVQAAAREKLREAAKAIAAEEANDLNFPRL